MSHVPRYRFPSFPSAFALLALAFGLAPQLAAAATPQPYTEFSNLFGSGGTITAIRVPILLANGTYIYKDVTISLRSDAVGNLTYSTASPMQILSAPLVTNQISPGTYLWSANGNYGLALNGPASLGNGVGKWTIVPAAKKYAPCASPGTFYTGSEVAVPIAARLMKAHITDTEYSYGVIGGGTPCGGAWAAGNLIGISQVGNQIEIASFTSASGIDQSTAVARYQFAR